MDDRFGRGAILNDGDPFARCQPVGFDDEGVTEIATGDVTKRVIRRVARPESRRGYSMTRHELLRERLARFQCGRCRRWPDDRSSLAGKQIDDAMTQRNFRTDDSEIDLFTFSNGEERVRVAGIRGNTARDLPDSRV